VLRNLNLTGATAGGTTGGVKLANGATYNRLLDSVLNDGNDNLTIQESDHNLIAGNTVSEGRHSIFSLRKNEIRSELVDTYCRLSHSSAAVVPDVILMARPDLGTDARSGRVLSLAGLRLRLSDVAARSHEREGFRRLRKREDAHWQRFDDAAGSIGDHALEQRAPACRIVQITSRRVSS
jgi:hypothetical protein